MFRCYKDLLRVKNDLADNVENTTVEKEELTVIVAKSTKVIADLQAQLEESWLESFWPI